MVRSALTAVPTLIACACFALPAVADEGPLPGRQRFTRGAMQLALLGGYGYGFRFGSDEDRKKSAELGDVRIWEAIPRFGISATDPLFGDSWIRGNVEFLFEGAFLWNTEPSSGFAAGAGSTLRYNFLRWERVVPFLDANFGVVHLDFDLARQSDGFNFNVGFGTGAHWFISERTAISTEVRWQHISNMNIETPNDGINDLLFLLGVSYFLP
jgi:hypothetical protein